MPRVLQAWGIVLYLAVAGDAINEVGVGAAHIIFTCIGLACDIALELTTFVWGQ